VTLVAVALSVALSAPWQLVFPGVWQREMPMAADGPLAPVRVIAVRLDPSRLRFSLDHASRDYGLIGNWTVDRMPAQGVVAFNAGQFSGGDPWGWLVRDGVESQPPGVGSLGMAFVVDRDGRVSLVTPDELPSIRSRAVHAFQSYPALLVAEGRVPRELEAPARGVDLSHRDSRLALGIMQDGSIVIVLTRFGAAGPVGETLPWGPTVPEMAALMKSLGCRRAMLLDGGLSSQLAVRGAGGLSKWKNWRAVPLGLIAFPSSLDRQEAAGVRRSHGSR
jgi:exopolysaccharide biosynthesis protein